MSKTILLSIATTMLFACNSGEKGITIYKSEDGKEYLDFKLSEDGKTIKNIWYRSTEGSEKEEGVILKQEHFDDDSSIMADVEIKSLDSEAFIVGLKEDKASLMGNSIIKFERQK